MLRIRKKITHEVNKNARMAELADAHDSKSCGKPCGFESHFGHQNKNVAIATFFYFNYDCGTRKGGCRVSRWSGACRNEGKNNPVDYFSDAGCIVPLWAPEEKCSNSYIFYFYYNHGTRSVLSNKIILPKSNMNNIQINHTSCFLM